LVYLTKLQKNNPEQIVENMKVVEQQLQTLGRVTRQALTFHRQEADAKECDLVELAEAALKLHADKILRHGITVERRFAGPAIASMFGTESLQVISNLILNALDAAPREQGKLLIRVKARRHGVHLIVCDNGTGIPGHVQARLFEPYMTSKASGTGIGLWLSQRIITKHQGSIRFRSSQEKGRSGTAFRIMLPATAA
jgi:signal transduction histidine kinase